MRDRISVDRCPKTGEMPGHRRGRYAAGVRDERIEVDDLPRSRARGREGDDDGRLWRRGGPGDPHGLRNDGRLTLGVDDAEGHEESTGRLKRMGGALPRGATAIAEVPLV